MVFSWLSKTIQALLFYVLYLLILMVSIVYYFVAVWPSQRFIKRKRPPYKGRRLVVITGADRGFGRLLAQALTDPALDQDDRSFQVLALCLSLEAVQELNDMGRSRLKAACCDVRNPAIIDKVVKLFLVDNTPVNLYALVNNAGTVSPGDFILYQKDLREFERVVNVNLMGTVRMTHALLPLLINRKGSRIINLSSVCGQVAFSGNSAYAASKFGVEGFSEALRQELLPHDVHVVVLRPGHYSTGMEGDYQNLYLANFDAASDAAKSVLGGPAYRRKVAESFKGMTATSLPPQQVVDALVDILNDPYPSHVHTVGFDAQTFFRALNTLPYPIADALSQAVLKTGPIIDDH